MHPCNHSGSQWLFPALFLWSGHELSMCFVFRCVDQSSPPAIHSKIKGFLMEKMKGIFHMLPLFFYYVVFLQRCIHERVNFPDSPKNGRTFFCYIWTPSWPHHCCYFFFIDFCFLLTGGKCHSYQWRTGGWSNNERVVWCQRSDGVNVTGESCHAIARDWLQQQWQQHLLKKKRKRNSFGPLQVHIWAILPTGHKPSKKVNKHRKYLNVFINTVKWLNPTYDQYCTPIHSI